MRELLKDLVAVAKALAMVCLAYIIDRGQRHTAQTVAKDTRPYWVLTTEGYTWIMDNAATTLIRKAAFPVEVRLEGESHRKAPCKQNPRLARVVMSRDDKGGVRVDLDPHDMKFSTQSDFFAHRVCVSHEGSVLMTLCFEKPQLITEAECMIVSSSPKGLVSVHGNNFR